MSERKNRKDGWSNLYAGLGKSMDKSRYTEFDYRRWFTDEELSEMYAGDGLGSKIIDVPVNDMTREWGKVVNEDDPEGAVLIEHELKRIKAKKHINLGNKWKNLYGGALTIIGIIGSGKLEEPLLQKPRGIGWLNTIGRNQVYIDQCIFQEDSQKKDFGTVEQYKIDMYMSKTAREPVMVHGSKCLEYFGKPAPKKTNNDDLKYRYWGLSKIQAIYDDMANMGGIKSSVMNILFEFIIGKLKIDGLAEMLANGHESKIITRMEIINTYKSIINMVLLDSDEEYIRDTANVSGLAELMDRFFILLAAVARIPVTKLFGRSPAGENATGEFDLRNYYDDVKTEQEDDMTAQAQKLVNIIVSYLPGIKRKGYYEFIPNPLFQLTKKEQAELEEIEERTKKIKAETFQIYQDMGVLDASEIAVMAFPEMVFKEKELENPIEE